MLRMTDLDLAGKRVIVTGAGPIGALCAAVAADWSERPGSGRARPAARS